MKHDQSLRFEADLEKTLFSSIMILKMEVIDRAQHRVCHYPSKIRRSGRQTFVTALCTMSFITPFQIAFHRRFIEIPTHVFPAEERMTD